MKLIKFINFYQVVSKLTGPEKNKQDQEVRRHKKHRDFLVAITSHHRNFKEYYNQNLQKMKKVNRSTAAYHVSKARKEQQMKEKAEKERLRALKVFFFFALSILIKLILQQNIK